jgi:hypothetical protein
LQGNRLLEEDPVAQASRIASRFALEPPIEAHDFAGKGNIHLRSFLIASGKERSRQHILQQINTQVFTRPRAVMQAMIACIVGQRKCVAAGARRPGESWEVVALVPTREGAPYLEDEDRCGDGCWRLMARIGDTRTHKSLGEIRDPAERLKIAEQAGSGLALFGALTEGMDTTALASPLPGYRDTRLYLDQLRSVLAGHRTEEAAREHLPSDPELRQATGHHFLVHLPDDEYRRRRDHPEVRSFLDLLLGNQERALSLLRHLDSGRIRRLAIHGDTKLENFLFDARTGQVKALVDLDTITPHTWLADWGDMVRSLANVAGEKELRPERIRVDTDVYRAATRGFLRSARGVTGDELELMAEAVEVIALELGMRFLTDHLRGDSYFKLDPTDPPDLNRVRGIAQLTLYQRLREHRQEAQATIDGLREELGVRG